MRRFSSVGRNLFFAAAMVVGLWIWVMSSVATAWWQNPGIFSGVLPLLLSCWSAGIVLVALLDARSRYQEYKRAKDLFFEKGFKPRIARLYGHSKCQRDAARVAAKDLGLLEQLDSYYRGRGYRWYHLFPDFVFAKPWILFSRRYWRRTLFAPHYTSNHFLW
jgi:hypothetical protein